MAKRKRELAAPFVLMLVLFVACGDGDQDTATGLPPEEEVASIPSLLSIRRTCSLSTGTTWSLDIQFGPEMLSARENGRWVSYVYVNSENGRIGSRDFGDVELKNA